MEGDRAEAGQAREGEVHANIYLQPLTCVQACEQFAKDHFGKTT